MARAFSVVNIQLMRARSALRLLLPGGGLGAEARVAFDASVEALSGQDADLDLDHVEPTGMLGDVMELQSAQHPSRFVGREGLVERAGGMGRQIVEHHPDALGLGIVNVGEFAHAGGEVLRRAALGDLHLAPGAVRIEEHEQVGGAVAPVLAVVALDLPGLGRDRLAHLADELDRALVEADHRPLRVGRLGIEIEHILHAGDVVGIDLGNAPHLLAPRLEIVLGQPPAHRLARQALVCESA